MARKRFLAHKFLDHFEDHLPLLRACAATWNGKLSLAKPDFTLDEIKAFIDHDKSSAHDELVEALTRARDLADERGRNLFAEAATRLRIELPMMANLAPEIVAVRILVEQKDVFNVAYDLLKVQKVDSFTTYRGKEAKVIVDLPAKVEAYRLKLAAHFKESKDSEEVIIRIVVDDAVTNLIIYHEDNARSEHKFEKNPDGSRKICPFSFRAAKQDVLTYRPASGRIEIATRWPKEERAMRSLFGEVCLDDKDFFEGPGAKKALALPKVTKADFALPVDEGHSAVISLIEFFLKEDFEPTFTIKSKNVLATLKSHGFLEKLVAARIKCVELKVMFPDSKRGGQRIVLRGDNKLAFKRTSHSNEIFNYLRKWGLLAEQ